MSNAAVGLAERYDLISRVAGVTGGTRGLGRTTVRAVAEAGVQVDRPHRRTHARAWRVDRQRQHYQAIRATAGIIPCVSAKAGLNALTRGRWRPVDRD